MVLGAAWPVAIVGLDVTQPAIMSHDYLASLRDHGGAAGQFVWAVSRHYEAFHQQSAQLKGIYVHDSSAVAYVLAPHLYTVRSGPVRVLTEGIAVGQTIQKPSTMPVSAPDWDKPARVQGLSWAWMCLGCSRSTSAPFAARCEQDVQALQRCKRRLPVGAPPQALFYAGDGA